MEIPVYTLELDNTGEMKYGIQAVALVDSPAIEEDFVKFSKELEVKFEVNNAEKRIVTGALMIPDQLIYREVNGKPFYVTATRETIYEACQKFASENRNSMVKATHESTDMLPDVFIFESFVTDENRVTTVKNFENLPVGTWFITCKVNNNDVWNQINEGTFKGFSLEALFKLKPLAMLTDEEIQMIKDLIE